MIDRPEPAGCDDFEHFAKSGVIRSGKRRQPNQRKAYAWFRSASCWLVMATGFSRKTGRPVEATYGAGEGAQVAAGADQDPVEPACVIEKRRSTSGTGAPSQELASSSRRGHVPPSDRRPS
jgi:hypothetical protein